jgi:hypothetical protein
MYREKWFLAKGPSRLTSKILKSVRTNMVHHCLRVRACCMRVMERNTPTRMCSEKWFLAKGLSRLVGETKVVRTPKYFLWKVQQKRSTCTGETQESNPGLSFAGRVQWPDCYGSLLHRCTCIRTYLLSLFQQINIIYLSVYIQNGIKRSAKDWVWYSWTTTSHRLRTPGLENRGEMEAPRISLSRSSGPNQGPCLE